MTVDDHAVVRQPLLVPSEANSRLTRAIHINEQRVLPSSWQQPSGTE
jgi:hypothetical protein